VESYKKPNPDLYQAPWPKNSDQVPYSQAIAANSLVPSLLCVGLRKLGCSLIHPSSPSRQRPAGQEIQEKYGKNALECSFLTPDGCRLHGILLNPPSGKKAESVIIVQGGRDSSYEEYMQKYLDFLHQDAAPSAAVFFFNLRSNGFSEGSSDPMKLPLDAYSAYKFLIERCGFAPDRIFFYGYSLGGALCTLGAAMIQEEYPQYKMGGINERSFESISSVVHHYFRGNLFGRLVAWLIDILNLEIGVAAAWEKLQGKKVIICHKNDGVVRHGASLHEAAQTGRKILLSSPEDESTFYHFYDLLENDERHSIREEIRSLLGA